ncbi:hypothetical protein BKA62DRAFT_777311 [Auriculariales sp. MPI-PUGE-AT-0066]|nr:hypothetical protein BKA62DRAFT_777311 [Auriculariales sp. MPI-PUGE-AT-0066]
MTMRPIISYDNIKSIRSVTTCMTTATTISLSIADKKMHMDLGSVTVAIDRLYLMAPQLQNQQVELKKVKLEQIKHAHSAGPSTSNAAMPVSEIRVVIDIAVHNLQDIGHSDRH